MGWLDGHLFYRRNNGTIKRCSRVSKFVSIVISNFTEQQIHPCSSKHFFYIYFTSENHSLLPHCLSLCSSCSIRIRRVDGFLTECPSKLPTMCCFGTPVWRFQSYWEEPPSSFSICGMLLEFWRLVLSRKKLSVLNTALFVRRIWKRR